MKPLLSISIIIGAFFLSGCKKEELPPLQCNSIKIQFQPNGTGPLIDSMEVILIQTGTKNSVRLDTMVRNPTSGTLASYLNFCGTFKYSIKIYHSTPGIKFVLDLIVNNKPFKVIQLQDNAYLEGVFVYHFPL